MSKNATKYALSDVRFEVRDRSVILIVDGRQHRFRWGRAWEYLLCALSQPGQEFRALQLVSRGVAIPAQFSSLAQMPETYLESMNIHPIATEELIPFCDPKTISQVCARMNYLIQKEAQLMEYCDVSALDEIRDEREQLQEYLCEVLNPQGRIRSHRDGANRDVRSVHRAINRVIQMIAQVEPELGLYLQDSVQTWNRVSYTPRGVEIVVNGEG